MNEVQIFPSKEFGDIRTAIIKGKEYFCGNDVASALCYQVPKNAISRHCKGALFWCPSDETQEMKYIPLGDVYRLIVKASSQSNNEEIKEKAGRFESLVFDEILPKIHKTGSYGVPQTIPEQIQLLAQGNVELNKRVDGIQAEVENIKSDLPILPLKAYEIEKTVRRKGTEVLGGKKSQAYNDRGLRQKLYNDLYANLKHNFDVRTYKAIRRKDVEKAVQIVNEYKPPLFLAVQIEATNAQETLDLAGGDCE